MSKTTPLGTVIPYTGIADTTELQKYGYMICDGSSLQVTAYPELFQAIGTSHGGDGNLNFNIPDYRGRFLRGVDEGAGRDKNAVARTAMNSGGAIGDKVGSIQGYATANAKNGFKVDVPHRPPGMDEAYSGASTDMARCERPLEPVSDKGGDNETRPSNASVIFLIKVKPEDWLPVGVIINFAGTQNEVIAKSALICHGHSFETKEYPELRDAIQTNCGGEGSKFNVPDYRGRFLRGKDDGTARDKDAANREKMAAGGATGDRVGSIQKWATARPVIPFAFKLNSHMPFEPHRSYNVAGPDLAKWNSGSVDCVFVWGGDHESRPENGNMEFYVLANNNKGIDIELPVGSVIAYAGNGFPDEDYWIKCDGARLQIKKYQTLFQVIGTAHGGDGTSRFFLPDYRGRFIRGVSHGSGIDPDAATRSQPSHDSGASKDNIGSVQDWATGKPSTNITASVQYLPTDNLHVSHAFGPAAKNCSKWTRGTAIHEVTGGDAETRPINASVQWFIKHE